MFPQLGQIGDFVRFFTYFHPIFICTLVFQPINLTISIQNSRDLSQNELSWAIEDLPEPFTGLISLTELSLSSNRIQTVHPLALAGLKALKTIHLSDNPIKWIEPQTFSVLPAIQIRMEAVDSLVCDCHSSWLAKKFSEESFTSGFRRHNLRRKSRNKENSNIPVCGFPPNLQGQMVTVVKFGDLLCNGKYWVFLACF